MLPGSRGNLVYQTVGLVSALSVHIQVARSGNYSTERVQTQFSQNLQGIDYPITATDIFQRVRSRNSTDKKDYVFALAGLFSELNIRLPIPRISKPVQMVEDVFRETTKVSIRKDGPDGLRVLHLINTPQRRQGLPSWVPD
jgi:hypothetical protein